MESAVTSGRWSGRDLPAPPTPQFWVGSRPAAAGAGDAGWRSRSWVSAAPGSIRVPGPLRCEAPGAETPPPAYPASAPLQLRASLARRPPVLSLQRGPLKPYPVPEAGGSAPSPQGQPFFLRGSPWGREPSSAPLLPPPSLSISGREPHGREAGGQGTLPGEPMCCFPSRIPCDPVTLYLQAKSCQPGRRLR